MTPHPRRLILARHGQTDWNRDGRWQGQRDIPLNEVGRAQARALAERLSGEAIDAVYASDLQRAAESARIVAARHGREPVLDPRWREIEVGSLTGLQAADMPPHLRELLSATARSEDPIAPGAETYVQIEARVRAAFRAVGEAHAGGTVLVVGHGGTLKVLVAHLIGLPPAHLDRLSMRGNTSVTEISFVHGRPQLVMINDTRHEP